MKCEKCDQELPEHECCQVDFVEGRLRIDIFDGRIFREEKEGAIVQYKHRSIISFNTASYRRPFTPPVGMRFKVIDDTGSSRSHIGQILNFKEWYPEGNLIRDAAVFCEGGAEIGLYLKGLEPLFWTLPEILADIEEQKKTIGTDTSGITSITYTDAKRKAISAIEKAFEEK